MLAWKIALRYLLSKKSHGVVNIISVISVVGVAVATAAIVIVLSVFNGFTSLATQRLSMLDPEIKITPTQGKAIADADSLTEVIAAMPGVSVVMPVVEERGLVIVGSQQMPVIFKGVPDDYDRLAALDSVMLDGVYMAPLPYVETTQISAGVAVQTNARVNANNIVSLYVPRRVGRINPANPAAAFSGAELTVTGIYQVGQAEYDQDRMYIPLSTARRLLQYDTEATAIEVALEPGTDTDGAIKAIGQRLGDGYRLQDRLQQQEESFRMIQVEKWVTFLMLAFILVIASFNIISTLSLLVIEKRDNMATMRALGAPHRLIRRIFMIQGWLISFVGGVGGIILGAALSLGQQHFGWIKLSGDPSHLTINVYPVRVEAPDLLVVLVLVVIVGLLTSQVTRLFTRETVKREP